MGLLFPGETKSSDDGEKEGIQIRHGNNEFTPGSINFFFVVGYMCPFVFQSVTVPLICFYRKKGVNVGHGMGRRLTMTSTRRL